MKIKAVLIILAALLFSNEISAMDIKIAFMVGRVQLNLNNTNKWLPARLYQTLYPEDVIRTESNGNAILLIDGKTKIRIYPSTSLRISEVTGKLDFEMRTGKLWASVHKEDKHSSLIFRTLATNLGIRGTEFIYEAGIDEDTVLVTEGKVAFSKIPQQNEKILEKIIEPGQIAVFSRKEQTVEQRKATADEKKKLYGDISFLKNFKVPFIDISSDSTEKQSRE